MSLAIGGMMSSPLVGKSPALAPHQREANLNAQSTNTDNNRAAINKPDYSQAKNTDLELKKYSDCVTNYAKAEISIQSGSNSGMIGTETTGTTG